MKHLLAAALLFASAAQAATPGFLAPAVSVALAQAADTSVGGDDDEDDEEEEEASPGFSAPAPATSPGAAPPVEEDEEEEEGDAPPVTGETVSPDAPVAVPPPDRRAPGEAQRLVSGAPLYNPNVAVHIVERKRFADTGKNELVLYPAAVQVNGKFTQHFGTAGSYVYHLQENFALQLTGQYNWFSSESAFNEELVTKVREQAQAATSLLLNWGVQGGVEVTPIYGKFAFYEDNLLSFGVIINAGAGVGSTRHQLKPVTTDATTGQIRPATFGDTGVRFLGSVGGGFRVQFGDRFAVRLEVRDLVYTARVDAVNGCSAADLSAMEAALRSGRPIDSVQVAGGCRREEFSGVDDSTGIDRSRDVNFALDLVQVPSSDVLNLISFYAGLAYLF